VTGACAPIVVPNPPTPPQPSSDLQVTKTVNDGKAYPGQTLTYTLKVTNHGPDATPSAKVTDTASLALTAIKATPSQGKCKVGKPTTCQLGKMGNGKTATIKVTAKVNRVGSEENTASGTTPNIDPKPHNNLDGAKTKVKPILRLSKTASVKTVAAGGSLTYHLKVTNPTSVAIKTVKVCDAPPRGLSLISSSPKAKRSQGKQCWTFKSLRAHKSQTITVHARAAGGAHGTLTNHATASGKGATGAKAKRSVKAVGAVLHLRKTASVGTVSAGQSITYHIRVSAARATAHAVKVCDRLPLGLVFTTSSPHGKLANGQECWAIGTLRAGRTRMITVHAKALKGSSGNKTNHATATASNAKATTAKATVRVTPAPKPPATPVTG
jgi:uncharacterized repeat protein (TIGR01451 family)